jgi:hypothetical protein
VCRSETKAKVFCRFLVECSCWVVRLSLRHLLCGFRPNLPIWGHLASRHSDSFGHSQYHLHHFDFHIHTTSSIVDIVGGAMYSHLRRVLLLRCFQTLRQMTR